MKICLLLTQLEIGGAQVRVFQTATELRRLGHDVDVVLFYKKRECFETEPKIILSDKKSTAAKVIDSAINLAKLFREKKYDALISNTAPANIIGSTIATFFGPKKRIVTQTQPPQRLSKPYRIGDVIVGTLGLYTTNIVNSNWTKDCFNSYNARYKSRHALVYDGIEPRVSKLSRAEARQALDIAEDDFVVATIGRFSKQKDQKTLLAAMAKTSGKLVVAGDGELKSELLALISELKIDDRVRLLGEVPGETIATLLRAADVFAFSSLWETFGLAPVEAAAAGLPIVASKLDVLQEVLRTSDGQPAADFVTPGAPEEFAAAIEKLRTDQDHYKSLSAASLKVAERFSLKNHVQRLLEIANR